MRTAHLRRLLATGAGLALLLTACGGGDEPDDDAGNGDAASDEEEADDDAETDEADVPDDGPTINVASFNFPESSILAEIYGQTLEDAGYPVEYQLDLGSRELIFPELQDGELDLLPEYLGSSLIVGFDEDAPEDVDSGVETLGERFAEHDITVLDASEAQNVNVFVTTAEFADEHGLETVSDLADAGDIVFSGAPECEDRETCYAGLTDTYGLDNVEFEAVQEASARLAGLQSGETQLTAMFSTDAPLTSDELVVLEDDEGINPPENIVPVLRDEILDAYGDDLRARIDEVSGMLTVEDLQAMNQQASEGLAPDEIAAEWLADNGLVG